MRLEVVREGSDWPVENVEWKVSIRNAQATPEMLLVVAQLEEYFKSDSKFLIPRNLTELMVEGGDLLVTVFSTDREDNVSSDQEIIEVKPDPKAILTGFKNSQYVSAG